MYATDDGQSLLVATDDDRLITLDAASAEPIGTIDLAGIAGFAPGGNGPDADRPPRAPSRIRPRPRPVLADLLGGDAATYEARLRSTAESTIVAGIGGVDQRANVDTAIDDGRLAGLTVETLPRVAIATADGVTFVAAATGDVVTSTEIDGGAHGLGYVDHRRREALRHDRRELRRPGLQGRSRSSPSAAIRRRTAPCSSGRCRCPAIGTRVA